MRSIQAISLLLAGLMLVAGCSALRVERAGVTSEADWLTEGDSAQRRNATDEALAPPLEEVWVYNAAAGFGPGSPLILGQTVLVGTRKGEVHAIDFVTGKRVGVEGFGDAVEGTPVVQDGVLFIPVGWGRWALQAYDLGRAQTRWKVKGAPIEAGLLALEKAFIAVDARAEVRKYAASGEVLWERMLGTAVTVHATPVLVEGAVAVATDQGDVAALDVADGTVQWTARLHTPVYTSMAADAATLFVPTTRGRFFALDAAGGQVRWKLALPDTTVRFAAPAVDDGLVVVGASDGVLRALDAATGELRWAFRVDEAFSAAPLITPQSVYIGSLGRRLYAVDRQQGTLQWEQLLKGRVKSALAARGGYLVVLSEPRFVYLFKSTSVSDGVASP